MSVGIASDELVERYRQASFQGYLGIADIRRWLKNTQTKILAEVRNRDNSIKSRILPHKRLNSLPHK